MEAMKTLNLEVGASAETGNSPLPTASRKQHADFPVLFCSDRVLFLDRFY
jgi:hypothetical protein